MITWGMMTDAGICARLEPPQLLAVKLSSISDPKHADLQGQQGQGKLHRPH